MRLYATEKVITVEALIYELGDHYILEPRRRIGYTDADCVGGGARNPKVSELKSGAQVFEAISGLGSFSRFSRGKK
jgi:hypothetical protein